jgi:hypothetical protein
VTGIEDCTGLIALAVLTPALCKCPHEGYGDGMEYHLFVPKPRD